MNLSVAVRAGGITAAAVVSQLALAGTAFADGAGEEGDGLGWGLTLLIFVGVPVAITLLLTLLVYGSALLRRPRYRPGRGWAYEPLWFAGPDDADEALAAVTTTVGGGGASARW